MKLLRSFCRSGHKVGLTLDHRHTNSEISYLYILLLISVAKKFEGDAMVRSV